MPPISEELSPREIAQSFLEVRVLTFGDGINKGYSRGLLSKDIPESQCFFYSQPKSNTPIRILNL